MTTTPRRIAVINQKGGAGKTTTAVNLAAALAEQGATVLLVDLDGQRSATLYAGAAPTRIGSANVLVREITIDEATVDCAVPGIDVLTGTEALYAIERALGGRPGAELRLRTALDAARPRDFTVIDAGPALGLLSVSALTAATEILVPVTTGPMELDAIRALQATVNDVAEALNPAAAITHVLACRADSRRRLDTDVINVLRGAFPTQLLDTVISERVRLRESYAHHQPITLFDPTSESAHQYRAAALEITKRSP